MNIDKIKKIKTEKKILVSAWIPVSYKKFLVVNEISTTKFLNESLHGFIEDMKLGKIENKNKEMKK